MNGYMNEPNENNKKQKEWHSATKPKKKKSLLSTFVPISRIFNNHGLTTNLYKLWLLTYSVTHLLTYSLTK